MQAPESTDAEFYSAMICQIKPYLALSFWLFFLNASSGQRIIDHGGIIRGDTSQQVIHLIFTGGDYNDGGHYIRKILSHNDVKAHFFFTGDFYRNVENEMLIQGLKADGHYLGPHSDKHLLYAPWENRDSLLVTKQVFIEDISDNYLIMNRFSIYQRDASLFMPPYEWYNDSISAWTSEIGLTLINFSPGTGSNADYTTPDMGQKYRPTDWLYDSILSFESDSPTGLNGFYLLLHIGTHPDRNDKFYYRLEELIGELGKRGYRFELIGHQ